MNWFSPNSKKCDSTCLIINLFLVTPEGFQEVFNQGKLFFSRTLMVIHCCLARVIYGWFYNIFNWIIKFLSSFRGDGLSLGQSRRLTVIWKDEFKISGFKYIPDFIGTTDKNRILGKSILSILNYLNLVTALWLNKSIFLGNT